MDIVHLNFSKAFNTIFHRILLDKVLMYRLDGRAMRWIEKQMKGQVMNREFLGTRRIWRSANSTVAQVLIQGSIPVKIFISDQNDGPDPQ